MNVDYKHIITIESGNGNGKPCVRGMHISVYDVLSCLASGMTAQQVIEDFPELTKEDIQACLGYAADMVQVEAKSNSEEDNWHEFSKEKLSNAYGPDEPEYDPE